MCAIAQWYVNKKVLKMWYQLRTNEPSKPHKTLQKCSSCSKNSMKDSVLQEIITTRENDHLMLGSCNLPSCYAQTHLKFDSVNNLAWNVCMYALFFFSRGKDPFLNHGIFLILCNGQIIVSNHLIVCVTVPVACPSSDLMTFVHSAVDMFSVIWC